jgi:ATP-dependent DNA ligase
MTFPILYKMDKKGTLRYREIVVEGNIYRTRSGIIKNRDTHTWKDHIRECQYKEGHGSYKSGEEVAYNDAKSAWERHKRKEAMCESEEEAMCEGYKYPILPVELARYNDLEKTNSLIEGEYIVQAKLDGERCTCYYKEGVVTLFTRGRKERPYLEHIKDVMKRIYEKIPSLKNFVFDGEILNPEGTRNTGRTVLATKEKHIDNEKMVFYIFCLVTNPDDIMNDRWAILEKLFSKVKNDYVKLVPILGRIKINDQDAVKRLLKVSLGMGYEGIVCWHTQMTYPMVKDRSNYSIKVKPFEDEEAEIVGAHEGTDEHKGLIVFEVNNGSSIQYITPSWTHDERRKAMDAWVNDPSIYRGKMMNIRYKCKNEYGNYVEAVGIYIREPET